MAAKHEARLRYVPFARHRWAHCYSARAGSWSFRGLYRTLYGEDYTQRDDQTRASLELAKYRGWFVSWFIREPVERFLSVYQHFLQLECRFQAQDIVYPMSPEMRAANADGRLFESIETFADRAFNDFPFDKHIAPQTGWGAECAHLIAPLHCAQSTWALIQNHVSAPLPDMCPHINSTARGGFVLETPLLVRSFYGGDITFWEKVCADFNPEDFQARRPDVDGEVRRQAEVVRTDQA